MHNIDTAGAVVALPTPAAVGVTVGYFSEGDAGTGVLPTQVSADWLNAVQKEIVGVILAAGLTLDKTSQSQLLTAIQKIVAGVGAVTAIAGDLTLDTNRKTAPFDTTAAARSCTLPVATTVPGEEWLVGKVTSDANPVNFVGTISGIVNPSITTQYTFWRIKSLGALGWIRIS